MKKFKLWFVRRYLHLVSYDELKAYTDQRFFYEQMNTAYDKLANSMLELYKQENKL